MTLPRTLLLFLFLAGMLRAEPPVTLLRAGEVLTYRVGWGVFGHAAEIKIAARSETAESRPVIRVTTTTATRGVVRALYPFSGDAWTVFDARDGRLLSGAAATKAGKKTTQATITFDYQNSTAEYVDHLQPKRSNTIALPPASKPLDLITALIQDRGWLLAPGQTRDALVLFDDQLYPLKIFAEHEETLSTPDGPRKTVVLVPRMTENPKGMFRRGGEVRVWMSADDARLPLRFEVKLKVGTAYAILTDYQPPTAE